MSEKAEPESSASLIIRQSQRIGNLEITALALLQDLRFAVAFITGHCVKTLRGKDLARWKQVQPLLAETIAKADTLTRKERERAGYRLKEMLKKDRAEAHIHVCPICGRILDVACYAVDGPPGWAYVLQCPKDREVTVMG